ncbi:MAG: hypothetical protein IPF93_08975 [Saprospiraceae bacterium]|nr:hypothetical protein [Saprospiraceae bacterium]
MDENCQHCLSAKDVLKAKYLLPDKFHIIEIFAGNIKLPSIVLVENGWDIA